MSSTPLLGRDRELRRLADLIEAVPDRGCAITVHGDPGIGKSSLLAAASERADSLGYLVLQAGGVETETQLPYAGLHDLVAPLLERADQLPQLQRRALLSAFGMDDDPAPQPFLIALAALTLLAGTAAERPVVLIADDVHWLDEPSQESLSFLARRVEGDPILIIAAVRKGHDSPFLRAAADQIEVRGLDDAASRQVLRSRAEDLSASEHEGILEQALGNPLALVELPAVWRASAISSTGAPAGPIALSARLERTFASRLDQLPPATRDVLLIAAVDTENDLAEILSAAGGLAGRPMPVETLEPAAAANLVHFDALRVRFRHPLVRSGVLQTESVRRRQAAHAALADVLSDEPYRRTWHRAQAIIGQDDAVADELEYNHTISIRRGSVGAAIAALERSAQLTTDSATRGRRLLLAAEHAFGLGRADTVDRLLTAAARNQLSELERARMEWLREIFNDGVPGDAARVRELCAMAERAIAVADPDLALNLLLGAALRGWWADTGPAARALVVSVTEQLTNHTRDPRYVATLAVAEPIARSHVVDALLSEVVMEAVVDADALRLYGMAAHAIFDPVRAVDFLDRAEGRLREQGRLGHLTQALTMSIGARLHLGDWRRAQQCVDESQVIAHDTGQPIWDTGTQSLSSMIAGLRGDLDGALALAADAEHRATGKRLNDLLACVQLGRGFGLISTGRHAEAYSALRRLFDPADPCFHQVERFHGIMYLAEAAAHAGMHDDARRVMADLEQVAEVSASSALHTHLLYARPVLADDDEAEDLFKAGLGADLVRWPLVKARLELAYGSWLRRQRRVAESRQPLRSARSIFEVIGAPTWAEQARTELRAAGERGTTEARRSAQELLSPQELQIARLAADGLSNKVIGERLFLSPRTVGSHLYRIFPKLDITSRSQIAGRLEVR